MDSVFIILSILAITVVGLLGLWLLGLLAKLSRDGPVGPFRWLFAFWMWDPLTGLATVRARSRFVERIVVGQIATVVRQNLPLATGLALAADSETGWPRTHLLRISKLLAQGLTLSEAMRVGFPDCPSLVLSLVAAGEKAGQLPAALDQAEDHLVERARRRDEFDTSVWPYPAILLAFMCLTVAGIMVAVIPKFKEIFADFGVELPAMTRLLMSISEWFVSGTPPGWILVLIPVVIVACFWLRRRRYPDLQLRSRIADWIRWHVPGFRRAVFGQGMSVMLRLMRHAVRSGMNLAPAARLAAGVDVNACLRRRMTHFADLLARGMDVGQASDAAGLGRVATTALAAGQRAGNMDAALRYAADYHDAIVSRWWIVLKRLAWPLSTLVMASIVGFVVLALFTPLVTLINCVMG